MMGQIANLERLIAKIDDVIAELPKRDAKSDYEQWRAGLQAEDEAFSRLVAEENGRSRRHADAMHLKLAGVSTSCTCGTNGTLRNWQAAARRRIDKLRSDAS